MTSPEKKPLVFLDTNVILLMLRGKEAAARLLSKDVLFRIRLAINEVVLSELLRISDLEKHPQVFQWFQRNSTVLPLDPARIKDLLPKLRDFRNRAVHSNDMLILASAADCDYLVTYDQSLLDAGHMVGVTALTPEDLLDRLQAAS